MIIESRYITHPLNHQRLSLVAPLEWFRECVVEVFISEFVYSLGIVSGRGQVEMRFDITGALSTQTRVIQIN
jgi:hypothetical protein